MGGIKWALMVLLGAAMTVAGCAAKPVVVSAPPPAVDVSYATIVSIRPVVMATGKGTDLLSAMGGVPASDVQNFRHGQEMEFILRVEGEAQPVSVVQGNEMQFRAGDRVVIMRDGRTRLRRAGA